MHSSFGQKYHVLEKLYFFTFSLTNGATMPYLPLLYRNYLHLPKEYVGVLQAITPFVGFIAAPMGSWLADRYKKPRLFLMGMALCITGILWMLMMPGLQFWMVQLIAVALALFTSPTGPLLDTIILEMLGEDKDAYGSQRMGASVGYGMGNFMMGLLINQTQAYWIVPLGHSCLLGLFYFTFQLRYSQNQSSGQQSISTKSKAVEVPFEKVPTDIKSSAVLEHSDGHMIRDQSIQDVRINSDQSEDTTRLVETKSNDETCIELSPKTPQDAPWYKSPQVIMFFITSAILGSAFSMIGSFLWIFLIEELGASGTMLGVMGLANVLFEIPLFLTSHIILRYIPPLICIIISNCILIVRVLSYTALQRGEALWWVIAAECLHGMAFATYWPAAIQITASMAPKGYETTLQGLMNGFYSGLGFGLGGLCGGFLYAAFGSMWMFRSISFILAFNVILISIMGWISGSFGLPVTSADKESPKHEQLRSDEP